jgi:hypothetical protein
MALSVSNARVVQEEADDFCRLYCRPRSRMACCSLLNCMLVRFTVRGYVWCLRPWCVCVVVLFCFFVVCLGFCSNCRSKFPFPVVGYCQLCLGWKVRCLAIGLRILGVPHTGPRSTVQPTEVIRLLLDKPSIGNGTTPLPQSAATSKPLTLPNP